MHGRYDLTNMSDDVIYYQFSRSKIERLDFTHFLSLYGPDKLPAGRALRALMNTMLFGIEGWDDSPREIHSIPEVRKFYTAFHEAWPNWLYFCNLESESLSIMILCCLPSLTAIKVKGNPVVAVNYDRLELLKFLKRDFLPMNVICERAGMFEDRIYHRTKAVFKYFDLPFDVAPPR
jgi:hypothetical protein